MIRYIFNRLLLQVSLTTKLWWWSDLNHHQCCVLFMSNYRLLPHSVRLRTPKHDERSDWKLAPISLASTWKSAAKKECSAREKYSTAKRNFSAKLPTMGWIINHHCTVHIARCMCAPHLPLGYGDFSRRQFRQMTTKTWIGAVVGRVFLEIKNWVVLHLNCSSTHLAKKISSPIYYW